MNDHLALPLSVLTDPKPEHLHHVFAWMEYPHDDGARAALEIEMASAEIHDDKWIGNAVAAGWLLREAVMRKVHNKPSKMTDSIAALQKIVPHIKNKVIEERLWRNYRSVAHFGWAYIEIARDYPSQTAALAFGVIHLPLFLVKSEIFRLQGEQRRFRQSKAAILRRTETVRLPFELEEAIMDTPINIDPPLTRF